MMKVTGSLRPSTEAARRSVRTASRPGRFRTGRVPRRRSAQSARLRSWAVRPAVWRRSFSRESALLDRRLVLGPGQPRPGERDPRSVAVPAMLSTEAGQRLELARQRQAATARSAPRAARPGLGRVAPAARGGRAAGRLDAGCGSGHSGGLSEGIQDPLAGLAIWPASLPPWAMGKTQCGRDDSRNGRWAKQSRVPMRFLGRQAEPVPSSRSDRPPRRGAAFSNAPRGALGHRNEAPVAPPCPVPRSAVAAGDARAAPIATVRSQARCRRDPGTGRGAAALIGETRHALAQTGFGGCRARHVVAAAARKVQLFLAEKDQMIQERDQQILNLRAQVEGLRVDKERLQTVTRRSSRTTRRQVEGAGRAWRPIACRPTTPRRAGAGRTRAQARRRERVDQIDRWRNSARPNSWCAPSTARRCEIENFFQTDGQCRSGEWCPPQRRRHRRDPPPRARRPHRRSPNAQR